MDSFRKIAALAMLGSIGPSRGVQLYDMDTGWPEADRPLFQHNSEAKRAAYTSEKPLTKRQKRRLRGKAKP